jgi:hypothetical protein
MGVQFMQLLQCNSGSEYRFYKVRDGYDADAIRFVDVERIGIYYITKISK